ncbi:MAG: hypothetical protein ABT15_04125 [Pseudonocardia sp. SCN 73-27]|nr:MAG: hypothetical protein ABS80_13325 [Pseudonocardia sp. SCN 72-51]ODV08457.1 MAG: hypothetical protein ABT15_04125 [Pseudonocardia sp. SCN 73-27]
MEDVDVNLAPTLAPFIVWLAAREPDDHVRRRHLSIVEHYLVWTADTAAEQRRDRFMADCVEKGTRRDHVAAALDRFAEYTSARG